MKYVDIIMPVYNSEKYVKDAIQSVKEQTNKNWRLIIIDDASTDDSIGIINQCIKDIQEKVVLIKSDKHIGVAEARNLGIKESKNRYIAFLDSDDIWNEQKLQKQIEFMENNKYVFTYTLYSYFKEKEKEVKYFPECLNYKQALKDTFILTSTVMIDTNTIPKEVIKMPNIASEDTATWWEILKTGVVAHGMNENLTTYRIHKEGLSANKMRNLKRTWNLYRKHEKLNIVKSMKYFVCYVFHAIVKRVI